LGDQKLTLDVYVALGVDDGLSFMLDGILEGVFLRSVVGIVFKVAVIATVYQFLSLIKNAFSGFSLYKRDLVVVELGHPRSELGGIVLEEPGL